MLPVAVSLDELTYAWLPMAALRKSEIQTSYDRLAAPYAEHIAGELAGKPLDRQLLDCVADEVRGAGLACDLGCGPGHVGRYLHDRGVEIWAKVGPAILRH